MDGVTRVSRFYLRHPWRVVGAALFCALLALVYAYKHLDFSVDRSDMLDATNPVQRDWLKYRKEFGSAWDFVVLVRSEEDNRREQARLAVEALGERLQTHDLFEHVLFRVDVPELEQSSLYFLSLADLRRLSADLRVAAPWLHLAPQQVLSALKKPLSAPELDLFRRCLKGLLHSLQTRGQGAYQSPLPRYQPELSLLRDQNPLPGQTRFYTGLEGGRTFLLLVQARDHSHSFWSDTRALTALREVLAEVEPGHPGVQFMLTGEPVINTDETVAAVRDTIRSALLATVVVALILMLAFGSVRPPLAVLVSLLAGIAWTCAFAAWSLQKLNMLTVNFATILVGLGMSFGVHVLYRFRELRGSGLEPQEAMQKTLRDAMRGNLVGAVTTAVAFLALHFTDFRSAGELGLVTGVGVMLCYLAMVTLLPGLLILLDPRGKPVAKPRLLILAPFYRGLLARPRWVLAITLVVSFYSLSWVGRIHFDYNLMHVHKPGASALQVERFLQRFGYSALHAVSVVDGVDEARKRTEELLADPTVARVESLVSFLPAEIEEKKPVVAEVVSLAKTLRPPPKPRQRGADELMELHKAYLATSAWLHAHVRDREFLDLLRRLDKSLDPENPGPVESGMLAYERNLYDDLTGQLAFLQAQQAAPPDVLANLPEAVKVRTLSAQGKVCLRIFPSQDCWEREVLERFVRAQQKHDPHVTGNPVLIYHYLEDMRIAYNVSGRNAFLVITLLLLLHYRSVRRAALALFPKLLGILWMLGLMGLRGEVFNPINFMALPLALGIGLLFGIHVLENKPEELFDSSVGPSILISGLTTIAGFSTMLLAEHRGVTTFGGLMAIGVACNLLTSLIVLPTLLTWMRKK